MNNAEIIDNMSYVFKGNLKEIIKEAVREVLFGETNQWISQSEAWRRYGRTSVNRMLIAGKLHTRRNGNRIEYYLKDLIENSNTKKLIFNK